jgi:RHS repeat-associated protein
VLYAPIYQPSSSTVLRVDDGFLAIGRTATTAVDNLDYLPFGEQIAGDTSTTHKFTGKERDAETGLDWFTARYMSSAQGRLTSPDPGGGHLQDPQTLNRYTYARNNPLRFTDSTGLDFYLDCKDESDTCHNGNGGNWHNNEKGNLVFEKTQVQSDASGNLTDQHGVTYTGNFDKYGFHFSTDYFSPQGTTSSF